MFDRPITPKRNHRSLEGREGWFPYYAGFSETFASSIIGGSKLNRNATILDPWNGSGTTTCAAYQLGYQAIGYDLNPVMVVVARARGMSHGEKTSIRPLLVDILRKSSAQEAPRNSSNDPLAAWFNSASTARIRSIEQAIFVLLVESSGILPQGRRDVDGMSDIAAFFYTALFRSVRRLLEPISASNPTWFKRNLGSSRKLEVSTDKIQAIFSNVCSQMVQEMACSHPVKCEAKGKISTRVGKSQAMQIDDSSVDLILTSPPYCTRIDYAVSTVAELALLGFQVDEFDTLRRQLMGTTTVPKTSPTINVKWGNCCIDFLDGVAKHPSKASGTYYLKNHVQYFHELYLSLGESSRVLKRDGTMVIVVQDSYYKNVHNNLSWIVGEMSRTFGLELVNQDDFPLRRTMASVNPRIRAYRNSCNAVESVLHLLRK